MLLALRPSLLRCRAGGRPAKELDEEVQQRLAAAGSSVPARGVERKEKLLFCYSGCGCWGYKQLRSFRRRQEQALTCPEHGRRRRLSQLLQTVRSSMRLAVPDCGPIVLEACLLPGSSKPFDMWLPKYSIAVEVDGRQHFRGGMHGKTAAAQYQRDRVVDAACKAAGLRLLRCHFEDDKQWGSLLQSAVRAVKANPTCTFVRYTNSYKFEAGVQGSSPLPTL